MDQNMNNIKELYTLFMKLREQHERFSVPMTMDELKERIRNLKDDEILSVQLIKYGEP